MNNILTAEFAYDLGGGLRRGKAAVLCLCPVAVIFQLQINLLELRSRGFRVRTRLFSVVFCVVRATHKFDLGFL